MTGNIDNLSEKELEAKMKQILNDHKDIIEGTSVDVTPKEQKSSSTASKVLTDLEDQGPVEVESDPTSH